MTRIKNAEKYTYNENIRYNPAVIKKRVRLSLMQIDGKLYLVNESDEILKKVRSEIWGFCGEVTMEDNTSLLYEDIVPNEGVLVYQEIEDDGIYWSDFNIGIYLYVQSEKLGSIRITPKSSKKLGIPEQPLIFDDFTSKNSVSVIDT